MDNDSKKLSFVRAKFGLRIYESDNLNTERLSDLAEAGANLAGVLAPGDVALVIGPSGSGKSTLIRAFQEASGALAATPISGLAKRPPVCMIRRDLDSTLATLARVGLGEARRLVTPAGLLSDGERARLSLARAIAHSRGRAAVRDVVCDEFTSSLDRLTARSVCRCIRRALAPGQRLVCATAHDDVVRHLNPDVVVFVPLAGQPEFVKREAGCGARTHSSVA
ncbi:MAG: hypothetical protein AAFY46_10135 [Planctomycetota bacterium]